MRGGERTAGESRSAAALDGRSETPTERADRNWSEILQEVRITQTSTQILGGFLLAVAFQPRFTELDDYQRPLYLVLVGFAGLATALGLALVALHRSHFGKRQKARVVRVGNSLLIVNLAVVAVLASGVTGLVFDFAYNRTAGLIALAAGLIVTAGLWTLVVLAGGALSPRPRAPRRS
ncbi:sodium:proton antiporter [Leucobacter weissii]|uniref:Sodium:proton antiporter n=1 Tax=Leucobacter weissii TaxID=1983706 RepID=A0A939S8S2_9MICO|nr:DUF6328 family protein [Leucobacter weissii]MBO1902411.1 sodium:proton antiporter [Leucobacter weissii]